jgi:hypothetical protein
MTQYPSCKDHYSNKRITIIDIRVSEDVADINSRQDGLFRLFNQQEIPAVVLGYPIAQQLESLTAVELSFETLLKAVDTPVPIFVDGTCIMNGPSICIELSREANGFFYWHEIQASSTTSCCSCPSLRRRSISIESRLSDLETGRHIFRLCKNVNLTECLCTSPPTSPYNH